MVNDVLGYRYPVMADMADPVVMHIQEVNYQ